MSDTSFSPSANVANDTAAEVAGLYRLLVLTLVAMCLIAGCLAGYLYGQRRIVKSEVIKGQLAYENYQTNVFPQLTSIQSQLLAYAKAHPDVLPILKKYGIEPAGAAPAPTAPPAGTAPKAPTPRR